MAKIIDVRDVPLNSLVVGEAQVRLRDWEEGVDDLARSISVHGLLEPIVVCPTRDPDKFEVVSGLRRFLALKQLGETKILAAVVDEAIDESTAKVLSLTENLMRRDLSVLDVIDACTALYKKYGSIRTVAEASGLPYKEIRQYVKYERLPTAMKELVDKGEVDLGIALSALDASGDTERNDKKSVEDALSLTRAMARMTKTQQKVLIHERRKHQDELVRDVIERVSNREALVHILVKVSVSIHRTLQEYAHSAGLTQGEAAGRILEEGLLGTGDSSSRRGRNGPRGAEANSSRGSKDGSSAAKARARSHESGSRVKR